MQLIKRVGIITQQYTLGIFDGKLDQSILKLGHIADEIDKNFKLGLSAFRHARKWRNRGERAPFTQTPCKNIDSLSDLKLDSVVIICILYTLGAIENGKLPMHFQFQLKFTQHSC